MAMNTIEKLSKNNKKGHVECGGRITIELIREALVESVRPVRGLKKVRESPADAVVQNILAEGAKWKRHSGQEQAR